MRAQAAASVFINCPFDEDYRPFFQAIVFTVIRCGFRPRCALELDDGGDVRIDKICALVKACDYGVHDISRTETNANKLPRFNMPFELGLFLGAKRFGGKNQNKKKTLVMDRSAHRFREFISDIGGQDVVAHDGRVGNVVKAVRNFLNEPGDCGPPAPGWRRVLNQLRRCEQAREKWCAAEGHDYEDPPFLDLAWFMGAYIASEAEAEAGGASKPKS